MLQACRLDMDLPAQGSLRQPIHRAVHGLPYPSRAVALAPPAFFAVAIRSFMVWSHVQPPAQDTLLQR